MEVTLTGGVWCIEAAPFPLECTSHSVALRVPQRRPTWENPHWLVFLPSILPQIAACMQASSQLLLSGRKFIPPNMSKICNVLFILFSFLLVFSSINVFLSSLFYPHCIYWNLLKPAPSFETNFCSSKWLKSLKWYYFSLLFLSRVLLSTLYSF